MTTTTPQSIQVTMKPDSLSIIKELTEITKHILERYSSLETRNKSKSNSGSGTKTVSISRSKSS